MIKFLVISIFCVYFYGEGTGDIYIKSNVGSVLSDPYSIEDCNYYSTTQYSTSSASLNISLPSAPFSLEYVLKQTNSNASVPYIDIGASSNNRMLVGQYARAGTNGLITYTPSQTNYPYTSNPILNQDNIVHFIYDGSDYTYWLNDLSPMTVSDKGITLSKIIHSESGSGGYIKNIKVKPL